MQNRLKERIKESGLTFKEVAERLHISSVGLSQLCSERTMPKLDTFAKFAEVLGVPAWQLFLTDREIAEICASGYNVVRSKASIPCPACGAEITTVLF